MTEKLQRDPINISNPSEGLAKVQHDPKNASVSCRILATRTVRSVSFRR